MGLLVVSFHQIKNSFWLLQYEVGLWLTHVAECLLLLALRSLRGLLVDPAGKADWEGGGGWYLQL